MNIYIEGNIGIGKTTFLERLREEASKSCKTTFSYIFEPVEEWLSLKDSDGKSILEKFYDNQSKWSFAFQMNSFISRTHKVTQDKSPIKLIERSVYTDKWCFATNCYKMGNMNKIEYDIYCKWHDWLCENFKVQPSGFIYLRTDPKVSYERIKKRSRTGESDIPLDYLSLLHTNHEEWMKREKENGIPVLYIDVTDNFYNDETKLKEILDSLDTFIYDIQMKPIITKLFQHPTEKDPDGNPRKMSYSEMRSHYG